MALPDLKIQLFADGADLSTMLNRYREGLVKGFTTNPTLMAKAGIRDYRGFAHSVLEVIKDRPISFEVFSDDFDEMETQALEIASWGSNVNIKIPISNTHGTSSIPLIKKLIDRGLKLNVTAIFTDPQLESLLGVLNLQADVIVSIFAGRIADTGVDPMPLMARAVKNFSKFPKAQILWASPREVLNIYQAEQCGCHIVTATDDLISKLGLYQKSLERFSVETVQMFYNDAQRSGFTL